MKKNSSTNAPAPNQGKTPPRPPASDPVHTWLVMMKAMQAIAHYSAADIEQAGLGQSDFRVLEVLLHKGPLPVNTLGPKVNLTPGSISVAVERLHARNLVTRAECSSDRRLRIVALTAQGREVILPVFRAHTAAMKKVFSELTAEERQHLEAYLKRIGRRAETLSGHDPNNPPPAGCPTSRL